MSAIWHIVRASFQSKDGDFVEAAPLPPPVAHETIRYAKKSPMITCSHTGAVGGFSWGDGLWCQLGILCAATGAPQCGHATALSLIFLPHSAHAISAILHSYSFRPFQHQTTRPSTSMECSPFSTSTVLTVGLSLLISTMPSMRWRTRLMYTRSFAAMT